MFMCNDTAFSFDMKLYVCLGFAANVIHKILHLMNVILAQDRDRGIRATKFDPP
jgi:hypothetical protein